ncbi:pyridoxal-phosphate dependent enzyme [Streptomyces lavendulae]|uniref:pyridoxal-phosphate dependent enzyme n=1 Tax=Streptomyces lavendulae TaxID=1914 RepID=UPI0036C3EC41
MAAASSGNHGASAAAYAAHAGPRRVVLAPAGAPPAVASVLRSYGAAVLPVPAERRWPTRNSAGRATGWPPGGSGRAHPGGGLPGPGGPGASGRVTGWRRPGPRAAAAARVTPARAPEVVD